MILLTAEYPAHAVPAAEFRLSDYGPGTYIYVVWNPSNNKMYVGPSKGATYADGSPVPSNLLSARRGGHPRLIPKGERDGHSFVGGGIEIIRDRSTWDEVIKYRVVFFSGNLNLHANADVVAWGQTANRVILKPLQPKFAQAIADQLGVEVYIPYDRDYRPHCEPLFQTGESAD